MISYKAFGLIFASDLSLHLPATEQSPHHVTIETGVIDLDPTQAGSTEGYLFHADKEQICVQLADYGKFLATTGNSLVIQPEADLSADFQETLLLSVGIPMILHQRGRLVLHGSAVEIDGKAVAFLAFSGWGKSTLALALSQAGHPLITDDHIVVEFHANDTPIVTPGYSHVKVYPNSAEAVGVAGESLPKILPDYEKRIFRQNHMTTLDQLPLAAICLLDFGPAQQIDPIPSNTALLELVRHTFVARYLLGSETLGRHFHQCAKIVSAVPVYRFVRTHDLGGLSSDIDLLERHFAASSTASA